jgi:hypothetical protein
MLERKDPASSRRFSIGQTTRLRLSDRDTRCISRLDPLHRFGLIDERKDK